MSFSTGTQPEVHRDLPGPACAICGRPMAPDQEWCLECGAARTVIARAPDWRIPVLAIVLTVAVIAGGFIFALAELGHSAGTLTVVDGAGGGRSAATAPTHPGTLATWPPGLDGYTVRLSTRASAAAADAAARGYTAHIAGIGVLSTAQHPQLRPARSWAVFAGRFPTLAAAQQAAEIDRHRGAPGAEAVLVARPGRA